jgi:hypothetical protein
VPTWPARATVLIGSALAMLDYILAGLAQVRAALGFADPHSPASGS